jgi:hypothetical protein
MTRYEVIDVNAERLGALGFEHVRALTTVLHHLRRPVSIHRL